ncbi:hypothetical protein V9T40_006035 [Parthenolecanium corni]|uniref:Uncharacterized protein n=1 Tax=Parthenolecanium corni TaxID=536013 RepID=A0AAN9YB03_9HEMI
MNDGFSSSKKKEPLFSQSNYRTSKFEISKISDDCWLKSAIQDLYGDEYTKITTPRQDVLFKKGYLTRRKVVPETVSENSVDQTSDDIAQDCSNNEDFSNYTNSDDSVQQFVCPNPQSYIDPSALYYGGGSYEIFDPYTGNVTVVVGPPGNQYPSNNSCQPIMTSVRPVPLQPVQWFNPVPSSDWCCSYSPQDKRYSTDSQNGSGVGSESSGVPESPPEIVDETLANNGPVFPPSYVYPGYMFGAPIYNVDGK